MLNAKIIGTLTKWGRKLAGEENHLMRATFVAPITDSLIESIERAEVQRCFRFMQDDDFLKRCAFSVPDGLVTIAASVAGSNGTTHKIAIKDVRPVRIEARAPGDNEPPSVVLAFQWIASDADVLWCWHAEGNKATLTIRPVKVVEAQAQLPMKRKPKPDPAPEPEATPPAAA
jgi:hypothetical protein